MSTTSTELSNRALLAAFVREGDEAAFGQLVNAHQSLVLGAATRRTGDPEMARDVAQQVFALLARKAAWLTDRESITGWLHHAANFLAARAVRCEARARARHGELARSAPARVPDAERWAALEDALAALGANDREALLLHFFEDRSYPEMAAQLGLAEPAVRKRVSRAMENLGQRLRHASRRRRVIADSPPRTGRPRDSRARRRRNIRSRSARFSHAHVPYRIENRRGCHRHRRGSGRIHLPGK